MDRGIAEERSQSPRRSMDGTGPVRETDINDSAS